MPHNLQVVHNLRRPAVYSLPRYGCAKPGAVWWQGAVKAQPGPLQAMNLTDRVIQSDSGSKRQRLRLGHDPPTAADSGRHCSLALHMPACTLS